MGVQTLTQDSKEATKSNGEDDKGPVPIVVVVNGGHTQEHEDDGFRRAAQHFQAIFQSGLGFGGYIAFHIILHGNAAESDSERLCNHPVKWDFLPTFLSKWLLHSILSSRNQIDLNS